MNPHIESLSVIHPYTGFVSSERYMLDQAIEQLVSGDFNARWNASKTLKSIGEEAHPALISIVKSDPQDPDLLGFLADILGHSRSPQSILALVHLLNHSADEDVQETVILKLAQQGPACVKSLLTYLDRPGLQRSVLKALIQINHPSTLEGFLKCIDHCDAAVRGLAFEGLGQFHQAMIVPLLIQGLKDSDIKVRGVCVKALGMRGQADVDETLIKAVSPLLYDANEDVCCLASKALGRFNHPLAFEQLWSRLVDPLSPPIASSLIQALGWSGHDQGVSYLLKLLDMMAACETSLLPYSGALDLVSEVIQTLSSQYDTKHLSAIEKAFIPLLELEFLPFKSLQFKQNLVMAIAQLEQESSIPPLIQVLKIEDNRLRLHVIAALKQINRDLSHETLLAMSHDLALDPALKLGIAIALQEW